ncbi:FMRFamide receptor [Elysia marginata]|uniref:FMRFamide receptor n=1 Tax=Elysia marginata TaxID=1093978 RepID=A0AAV4FPR2_9GAST|nr:FMRFamide receptor [Elysia marginata]
MANLTYQTRYPYFSQGRSNFSPWLNETVSLGTPSNQESLPSVAAYDWRVGLFGFGGTFICCCGVICNIIAIIVLSRLRSKSSAPFLLVCLSSLDCIYLLSFLFLETLTTLSSAHHITSEYRKFSAPIYGYLYSVPLICQTCTAYMVVVISLERFVVIVLPFRAQAICSFKWALSSVCLCVAFSILYHIPDYMAFYHVKVWDHQLQTYVDRIGRTEFGSGYFYTKVYFRWMNFTFNFLLPFALLLTFNGVTLTSFYKNVVPEAIRVRQAQQRRLAIMIISMTAVFFICELMAAIAFIFTADLIGYHNTTIHINRLSALADTLMLLKSAVNFLIYCATGSAFREEFRRLFCCQTRVKSVNGVLRARSSSATNVVNTQAGRMRPLSSLSSSSSAVRSVTLTSLGSHNVGIPRSDNRYRRSSSNASSVADDGPKVYPARRGSSGSGTAHTTHTRARISLSTIAASDTCVDRTPSPLEMAVLIERREGSGEGGLKGDPEALNDSQCKPSDYLCAPDINDSTNKLKGGSGNLLDIRDEKERHCLLSQKTDKETHSGCLTPGSSDPCKYESFTHIDDNVFDYK